MELNQKKLERTSKIIYYTISTLLCAFLILLSFNVLDDIDRWATAPNIESYQDKIALSKLQKEIDINNARVAEIETQKSTISKTLDVALQNYENEKQSYDNWLEARKTVGSPDNDKEVLERAKKLDEFYKVEQGWRKEQAALDEKIQAVYVENEKVQSQINEVNMVADTAYQVEMRSYEMKVFLIRLLIVLPILVLGIFFFMKKRQHKYWPLFFGFSLFSVWAFFFGLVPYLPSYGGYIRYGVGIILCILIGYYAINRIRKYMEQKQSELKVSSSERAKKVMTETAEKSLANHVCPSCGKDFIIKKWDAPNVRNIDTEAYKLVTDFCRYCGLELFKKCASCGNKNFAHLPYCSCCGVQIFKKEEA
jgi:predicted RNA-binding Zn-ribbon protein involved in translation (DUF1610 family)